MTDTDTLVSSRCRASLRIGGWPWLSAVTVFRLGLVAASVLLFSADVSAQNATPEARMMAQALFDEGRALMETGEHHAACVKFEESNALDPAMGTQFRLADCYALTERLASAWILFVDVAAQANVAGQPAREQTARRRADELEPRLNRMVIDVDKPFEGIVITRNETPVGRGQWGAAIPVDAGEHAVVASAESHHSWRRTVRITGENKEVRVRVPALEPLPIKRVPDPPPPPPKSPPPEEEPDNSVRSAAALAMGVLGLIGIAIGAGAGIVAIDKTSEAEKFCTSEGCFDRGLSLREEARRAAAASTVSFAIGGSALVSGLIIWLTIPEPRGAVALPGTPVQLPGGVGGPAGATSSGATFGLTLTGTW